MRKRNWREYNRSLVQRGSLTFLVDPEEMKSIVASPRKGAGRPLEFSDRLIEMLLLIKIHYKLPYRMLEGFCQFLLAELYQLEKIPTYSLICKRAKQLALCLPALSPCRPTTIIVDATGMKVEGEGEWKRKVHGKSRSRKWIKIHVAIDAKTQEIVGELLTEACVDDGKAFPLLINQVASGARTVIGDGAYDDKEVRELIRSKGAAALIPPPSNGVCPGRDTQRDRAIKDIHALGGDKLAKSIWGKLTGYSQRALVETTFSRWKKMFGERFFSRTRERQEVESRLKCLILNKMRRSAA